MKYVFRCICGHEQVAPPSVQWNSAGQVDNFARVHLTVVFATGLEWRVKWPNLPARDLVRQTNDETSRSKCHCRNKSRTWGQYTNDAFKLLTTWLVDGRSTGPLTPLNVTSSRVVHNISILDENLARRRCSIGKHEIDHEIQKVPKLARYLLSRYTAPYARWTNFCPKLSLLLANQGSWFWIPFNIVSS
jgi:hypothetical protein